MPLAPPPISVAPTPQRVALFTGNYHHIADGVSLTLNRLVAYLQRQGIEVLTFAPTVEQPALDHVGEMVALPSFPMPGRPEYRVTTRVPEGAQVRLAAFDPGLVHIATPDLAGCWALRWAQTRGVPVVSTYHTHFASYLKYYRLSWLEGLLWTYLRWFYNACEHVYIPSSAIAAELRAHGITTPLLPFARGIEADRFSPEHRSPAWREAHGIGEDEVAVGFVGRLVWEKGLDVFAELVEALRARGLPARGVLVGEGPARADLEERLPQAVFVGHQEGPALATAYASLDVFCFPSDTETFGNVTLEAMASGLPTVCAAAGGALDLVVDGETGFLCLPGDADAFADATVALVTDAALRTRMGHAARQRAHSYSWPSILDRLLGHYAEAAHAVPA